MSVSSSGGPVAEERHLWGWERFFDEIGRLLSCAQDQYGTANENFSHYVIERIRACILNVSSLKDHILSAIDNRSHQPDQQEMRILQHYASLLLELLSLLRRIGQQWQVYLNELNSRLSYNSYRAQTVSSGRPGRPRFEISRDQILYLHSLSFSWSQISSLLGVSRMTIYRRRAAYGLLNSARQTMSDEQLRSVIRDIHSLQPALGEVMIWGMIRARGFNVSRERLRRALRNTDPLHTALRWRGNLTARHPYSVPGPNSLWHIGKELAI